MIAKRLAGVPDEGALFMANVALIVHLDIKAQALAEFLVLARAHGTNSQRIEAGCLRFDVLVSTERDNHVVLVEVYEDDAALESHWNSKHMARYLEQVEGMIENRQRYRCAY